ncbi:MAG: O-antigen ligase family protein [Alphaproteobacteria bacterium]|nr:O-antigen ligase family protein [Alphaproteobacteria bacterium]
MNILYTVQRIKKNIHDGYFVCFLSIVFLLLPYFRMLFFDFRLLNILFFPILIPLLLCAVFNKEFISKNKEKILALSLFNMWIIIGTIYSPSEIYSLEKLARCLLCSLLFFLPVIIKNRDVFFKSFFYICFSLILVFFLQEAFKAFFLNIDFTYSLYFARFCFLLFMLLFLHPLFLHPLFKRPLFNYLLLCFLFCVILLLQSKGVVVALIVFIFALFFFDFRKQFFSFFRERLLIKFCFLAAFLSAIVFIIDNYSYRYKLDTSVSEVRTLHPIFREGKIKDYYFDEDHGMTVIGNKYHVSMYFPFSFFQSNQIAVRAKITSEDPNSNELVIVEKDERVARAFHPGDGKERSLEVKYIINDKPQKSAKANYNPIALRVDLLNVSTSRGDDIKTSIGEIEIIDGSFENGRSLFKENFKTNFAHLLVLESSESSLNKSYSNRVRHALHSIQLIFFNAKEFFLGWGTASYPVIAFNQECRDYPHNFILELLLENGVIGLILYGFFLLTCYKSMEKRSVPLFIGLIMMDMFSSSYSEARLLFFFLGYYSLNVSKNSYTRAVNSLTQQSWKKLLSILCWLRPHKRV